ncbi:DUF6449 domain-containing protein [Bariatricus sp. SGI.154]|uniref:DUF6449 domain-containing protein n=1 Tax=Bariatricus sp. SGI.154 TaxID=3420549 RepID=UPI003D04EE54
MTSRRLYNNWIREAGRGHIAAILSWGGFFAYFVLKIMALSYDTEYVFFGIGSGELYYLCAGLGIGLAFTEFSYLFQGKKQDFYYSLPVKKSTIFWSRYMHGILLFVIPFILTQIVCTLFEASRDQGFALYAWTYFVRSIGMFLLIFLLFYHLSILAVVVSGKVVAAIVVVMVLIFYFQVLIQNVLQGFARSIFQSYYRIPVLEEMQNVLTPGKLTGKLAGTHLFEKKEVLDYLPETGQIGAAIIWVILLMVLAVIAHRGRRTEMTGRVFVSSAVERIFEGFVSVLAGLFFGKMLMDMLDIIGRGMAVVGIFLCGAGMIGTMFVHLCVEWLVRISCGDVKVRNLASRRRKQMAFEGMAVCMIALAFLGYRHYFDYFLPESADLDGVAISVNGLDMEEDQYRRSSMNQNHTVDNYVTEERLKRYLLKRDGMTAGMEWLAEIVEREDNGIGNGVETAVVCYHMKDGSRHYRRYAVDLDALDAFSHVYETAEYKEKAYPFIENETLSKERITWTDGVTDTVLKLSGPDKCEFLKAYQRDVSKMKMADLKGNLPIGNVRIDSEAEGIHEEAVVYSFFVETNEFLIEHGIDVGRTLRDYRIISIKIQTTTSVPAGHVGGALVRFYDEADEIAKWAETLVPEELAIQPVLCPADTSIQAEVEIEEEDTSSTTVIKCYSRK